MTDNAGAALVALRWAQTGELVCAQCGQTFSGHLRRKAPRYCSTVCRQTAWRERREKARRDD